MSCLVKVIMEGLKDLGFVKGDPMEAVKAGAHAMFYALWPRPHDGIGCT